MYVYKYCPRTTTDVRPTAFNVNVNVINRLDLIIVIIINVFVQRHKVVTSEALGPGSVLLRKGKRESPREEECH